MKKPTKKQLITDALLAAKETSNDLLVKSFTYSQKVSTAEVGKHLQMQANFIRREANRASHLLEKETGPYIFSIYDTTIGKTPNFIVGIPSDLATKILDAIASNLESEAQRVDNLIKGADALKIVTSKL